MLQFSLVAYQETLCRRRECCTDVTSVDPLEVEAALVQVRAYCVCRVLCIVCRVCCCAGVVCVSPCCVLQYVCCVLCVCVCSTTLYSQKYVNVLNRALC